MNGKQSAHKAHHKAHHKAMTTTYHVTDVAKLVRVELKAAFPKVKFSVRSSHHSVRVEWTDGPSAIEVSAITGQFSGMGFDGMQDMQTYHRAMYKGEEVQFYCYAPDLRRNLTEDLANKMVASIARQGFKVPAVKKNRYDNFTYFCWDEYLGHGFYDVNSRDFNEFSQFITHENADTLEFWTAPCKEFNSRTTKSRWDLTEEVLGRNVTVESDSDVTTVAIADQCPEQKATVTQNKSKNGVEIKFTEKPDQDTIEELKAAGFKWSHKQGLWYAKRTAEALAIAYEIAAGINSDTWQLSAEEIAAVRALDPSLAAQPITSPAQPSHVVSLAAYSARKALVQAVRDISPPGQEIDFSYLLS